MKKRFFKYCLTGLFLISLVGLLYYYLTENYLKFDRTYIDQIDKYESVYLKLKKSDLSTLRFKYDDGYSMYPHAGVTLDFTIEKDTSNFLKLNLPEIQNLFDENLIESIHILSNGEILFQLKYCDRPNCINDDKGFCGFYTHYLSRDQINFKKLPHTKLEDSKSFGRWNYYIVWGAKG